VGSSEDTTVVRRPKAVYAPPAGGYRRVRALKAKVHSAKVMYHEGIKPLLERAEEQFFRLSHLWLDAGYRGEDKGKDWVEKTLGWSVELVERPRKAASKEVLMNWAAAVLSGVSGPIGPGLCRISYPNFGEKPFQRLSGKSYAGPIGDS